MAHTHTHVILFKREVYLYFKWCSRRLRFPQFSSLSSCYYISHVLHQIYYRLPSVTGKMFIGVKHSLWLTARHVKYSNNFTDFNCWSKVSDRSVSPISLSSTHCTFANFCTINTSVCKIMHKFWIVYSCHTHAHYPR